ncbi:MAG: hypothetical protein IKV61_04470 [Clostridia bacterium]|nr:hypothetical protein [Clostridia bacterium]
MQNITFKTKYLEYVISPFGDNISFKSLLNGKERIKKSKAFFITEIGGNIVNAKGVSYNDGTLLVVFEDETKMELKVEIFDEYLTFELSKISRQNFLNVAICNVLLNSNSTSFEGVLMALTLSTKMHEHPGNNRVLLAQGFPKIGLFSTKNSSLPIKCAIIGAPSNMVASILKQAFLSVEKGELPTSNKGGPFMENGKRDAEQTYTILWDSLTTKNAQKYANVLKKFAIKQVNLHHYGHFMQGDFAPNKIYKNGVSDLKKAVDILHENGILVGVQSYANFISLKSSYLSPIPHKDLDVMRSFTLRTNLSKTALTLSVLENTNGVSTKQGYVYMNSPYIWIDDELIEFEKAQDGTFYLKKRGVLGTKKSSHKANATVKQLKFYFNLPMAKAQSPLFYEIAKRTAQFYNDIGGDVYYLDALDGTFVLDEPEYAWYHAMDFVREMFKHLKRDIVFNCCYNPCYTASWFVRSRYGAIDTSVINHKGMIDAHVSYNEKTAKRMRVTSELGWHNLFEAFEDGEREYKVDQIYSDDIEYLCSKAYATSSALGFLYTFDRHKNKPCYNDYAKLLTKYSDFRSCNTPTANQIKHLTKRGNFGVLVGKNMLKAHAYSGIIEHENGSLQIKNAFKSQAPHLFRLEALNCASNYNSNGRILLNLDDATPIKTCTYTVNSFAEYNYKGVGVWCYGDNSNATICINLINTTLNKHVSSEHYIKVDFLGWRYFAFSKSQNGVCADFKGQKLEYKNYLNLQKFYGYYRGGQDFNVISKVKITVKGKTTARLKPIKLLPIKECKIENPTITIGDSSLTIYATLKPYEYLEYNGKKVVHKDRAGNVLSLPKIVGELKVDSGNQTVKVRTQNGETGEPLRAQITLVTKGGKL